MGYVEISWKTHHDVHVVFEGEKNHKKGGGGGWIVFLETSSLTF